jgi:hypothetical protein
LYPKEIQPFDDKQVLAHSSKVDVYAAMNGSVLVSSPVTLQCALGGEGVRSVATQSEVMLAVGAANEDDTIAEAMRICWNCMMVEEEWNGE